MTPPVSFPAWLRQSTRHIWNRPHLSVAALLFLGILLTSAPERHSAYSLLPAFDAAATSFLLAILLAILVTGCGFRLWRQWMQRR